MAAISTAIIWWFLVSRLCGLESLNQTLSKASGHILEIGLYKDHPRNIFKALASITEVSFSLLKQLLAPCLCFTAIFVPVLALLASTYSLRPLNVAEQFILSARSQGKETASPTLSLQSEIVLDSNPIVDPKTRTTYWRLQAGEEGRHNLKIGIQGKTSVELPVQVGGNDKPLLSNLRGATNGWLWQPYSRPLAHSSGLVEVRLQYPQRELWVSNLRVHWAVLFAAIFLLALFPTKRLFS